MDEQIQKVVDICNQGGIVIFPTDTAYGIGCRVDNIDAINRLYKIRKRSEYKPMSLLVDSIEMVKQYVTHIPDEVTENLLSRFWPGALTVILTANKDVVPSLIRAHGDTIGLRMPDHEQLLTVISKVGVPILGPSANFSGEKTPFSYNDLNKELVSLVDYVMVGKCKGKEASTVIDCTKQPYEIVRQGAVRI